LIVRVVTARVKPGRANHFNALIRQQLPIMRQQSGLVYVKLARRLEVDGSEEVVLFEEWLDPPSVYAWAGPELSRPRLPAGAEEETVEVTVTHYEALDIDEQGIPQAARLAGAGGGGSGGHAEVPAA
jgi:heme-degrading monooxygenase HmoA